MSYPASNIIQINTRFTGGGLTTANFASAVLFVPASEAPSTLQPDTFKTYFNLTQLGEDFPLDTETYKASERFLGSIPRPRSMQVYIRNEEDTSWTETLNKARNAKWWYISLFTKDVYESEALVDQCAQWCDSNGSIMPNNVTGDMAVQVRDENVTDDIASKMTAKGYRHVFTATHATDPYAGNALIVHYASVNYSGTNTAITGTGKKSPGLVAEELTASEYTAMQDPKKRSTFYTMVDLQGSTDTGRWLNTRTHSTYGEYIDDVINIDALINDINVTLYNTIMNQPTKLPQTTIGQAILIGALRNVCDRYITNGVLGERNYINPDNGQTEYTRGYEILTVPEAILDLTDPEREARLSAPLRLRVFRAGAIESAIVDIEIL